MTDITLNQSNQSDSHQIPIDVISLMIGAINTIRLYAADHPRVEQYVEQAYEVISRELIQRTSLTLLFVDEDIVVDNRRLVSKGPQVPKFIRMLKEKQIEGVTFSAGLTRAELHGLIKALASRDADAAQSTPSITLGKVHSQQAEPQEDAPSEQGPVTEEEIESMQALCEDKLDTVKGVFARIEKKEKIDIQAIEAIITEFIHRFRSEINPLALLASVKSTDDYTFTHVVNVCILTMFQAENLGFGGDQLHRIGIAASLHDTGKLFIPGEILNKKGKLTGREWEIITQHPVKGAQYLLGLDNIPRLAALCCLEHHVRYDGDGYPAVPDGYQLHIVSQMISIADAFDAMRSRRVYRDPLPLSDVIQTLQSEKSKAFNPHLVDHFLNIIDR